jgi:phosphoglycolate phosphatase-like HAD superfamily hydrolase
MTSTAEQLKELQPTKEFFIGIDSDGCAFDTMEPKHKECFCPTVIWKWNLEAVSKYAREAWDFVNLYGQTRGCNRFLALRDVLDYLRERPEVKARNVEIPVLKEMLAWIDRESKLGNPKLIEEVEKTKNPELTRLLDWSVAVNDTIEKVVRDVPPFPGVEAALQKADDKADMIVVSQTPFEALDREWRAHGIDKYVRIIAGQECGKKSEHLEYAAQGKYDKDKIIMLGDAYGDFKAAQAIDALFFPIIPGHEEDCWARFKDEALDKFFAGTYRGEYSDKLAAELEAALPATPPWKK